MWGLFRGGFCEGVALPRGGSVIDGATPSSFVVTNSCKGRQSSQCVNTNSQQSVFIIKRSNIDRTLEKEEHRVYKGEKYRSIV